MRRPGNYPYPRDLDGQKGTEEYLKKLYNSLIQHDHAAEEADDLVDVDSRPWVYPEDHGAVGDGTTDDTTAIQAAITAASGGTLVFGKKTYCTTGLTITTPIVIVGSGWGTTGTVIENTSLVNPTITISAPLGYTGATISNLCIKGNSDVNGASTSGEGMLINAQGQTLLHRVYLYNHGGYGLKITGTSYGIVLDDCRVEYNVLDGIYGRTEGSAQINAVTITNSEITNNTLNGINLWANALRIVGNIIEGNTGAGIYLSGSDMVTTNASMYSAWIEHNYFEANAGGHIVGVTEYAGGGTTVHYAVKVRVDSNWFYLMAADVTAGVTAVIDLSGAYGGFKGFVLGRDNNFMGSDLVWFDGGDCLISVDAVETCLIDAVVLAEKYVSLGDATLINMGSQEFSDITLSKTIAYAQPTVDTVVINNSLSGGDGGQPSSVGGILWNPEDISLARIQAVMDNPGADYWTHLEFWTDTTANAFAERMRLTHAGNLALGITALGTDATKSIGVGTGTPPSTSPADAFQLYSADFAAGNACPTFRTEGGTVIVLNQDLKTTATPTFAGASFTDQPRTATSLYRRYYHIPLGTSNPGASGATWVNADANTTGGWQLNAAGENIRGGTDVHSDWDGASDMKVEVRFNVNVDNTGGAAGDTVDLKLVCYYKGIGDTATKTQTVEVPTTVGASARYKSFKAEFTIDWNATDNVVEVGDHIALVLNLETDTSEVDDVIITGMSYSYLTTHIGVEDGDE